MSWDPLDQLDDRQRELLQTYASLLLDVNRRINLISREDEDQVFTHHVRHCLYLTHRRFPQGATVVDWGTGGGLPAIPLAIACPEVRFLAVDAVDKKVRAVRAMARRLGIPNLEAHRTRAERFSAAAAYSVSRATASLTDLWTWHTQLDVPSAPPVGEGEWSPGLLCLKGGDLAAERSALPRDVQLERIPLSHFTQEPYFREKAILHCTR